MLKQSTLLDNLFLKDKFNYDAKLTKTEEENIFLDYYLKTCQFINENHFARPDIKTIESVINGTYVPVDKKFSIVCSISDKELREYIFKSAMAKQFIYDMENGRTSMVKGDQTFSVCPEFVSNLSMLGFIQTGMFARVGK